MVASSVGRNAYFVLTAWIAVDIGHRASALAILLALGSAAELLTSNVGGAVVDRLDRSIVCMICDLLRVALMVSTGVGFSFVDPSSSYTFHGSSLLSSTEPIRRHYKP